LPVWADQQEGARRRYRVERGRLHRYQNLAEHLQHHRPRLPPASDCAAGRCRSTFRQSQRPRPYTHPIFRERCSQVLAHIAGENCSKSVHDGQLSTLEYIQSYAIPRSGRSLWTEHLGHSGAAGTNLITGMARAASASLRQDDGRTSVWTQRQVRHLQARLDSERDSLAVPNGSASTLPLALPRHDPKAISSLLPWNVCYSGAQDANPGHFPPLHSFSGSDHDRDVCPDAGSAW